MNLRHSGRVLLALALWLAAAPLAAQVERLPEVLPEQEAFPGRLVSHPESPAEVLQAPGESGLPPQLNPRPEENPTEKPALPPGARSGMFQKLIFDGTWLGRTAGSGGLGMYDLELKTVLALPAPTPDSPLLIVPGFAVHYMDGPDGVDMPPRLFDAYCQFRWLHRFSPAWGVDAAIAPSVFSDFQQQSSEAFRWTGHAAAAWNWSATTKLVFGVGYFNRLDVKVLPIGGLIWTPNDDVSIELFFPKPRLARRVYWAGKCAEEIQDWIYAAVEFGGGTWAIAGAGGEPDLVDIKDYRLILGAERKVVGGLDSRVEIGYVFARRIQYRNGLPEFDPSDTVMLRGGLSY